MSNKISGYTCVWNGIELDYCFDLTILSLLRVCDEVVVGYRESSDGTLEVLESLARNDSRIRIITQKAVIPNGDLKWWTDWINQTRAHLKHPVQLMLDADELIDDTPQCLSVIRQLADGGNVGEFHRLNFVKDGGHLIPVGHVCGHVVSRLAPSHYFMPSDEPYSIDDMPEIHRQIKARHPALRIFHYGFLRRSPEFYKKCDRLFTIHFGERDVRLDAVRAEKSDEWFRDLGWAHLLIPWAGRHPDVALAWLRERGRL